MTLSKAESPADSVPVVPVAAVVEVTELDVGTDVEVTGGLPDLVNGGR
jgi:hypothetical protein